MIRKVKKKCFALIGESRVSRGTKIAKFFKFCDDKFSQICENK